MSALILIVEDESMIAQDLQELLISCGYQVPVTVGSAHEAVKQAQMNPPDLILMDIRLKGKVNGIEAAAQIKAENASIAILYLTSYTDHNTLQEAKATEPFGYILKPFREKELLAMIEIAIYRQTAEKQALKKQSLFKHLLQQTSDAVILLDENGYFEFLNDKAALYFPKESLTKQKPIYQMENLHTSEQQSSFESLKDFLKAEVFLMVNHQESILFRMMSSPLKNSKERISGYALTLFPIESINPEPPLDPKQLHICASCKQIKGNQGEYQHFEPFFRVNYNLQFSHGMCPGCFSELYPKYYERLNEA